ncbi:LPXTG cell wall anchor domain-containing protein [Parapedobacter pyrenivorans]|uniref:LPXTG cell wall anchor domain-containing protein n=1 Tax=Parapedobacter pyrenivorans TaxID=1305674 RepID=UPI00333F6B44
MKNLVFVAILMAVATQWAVCQQTVKEPLIFDSEVYIDSAGNATFSISGKLNAMQWQWWNYAYGAGNSSNLKRNIEKSMSSLYLYDFKYEPNEMDRSFKLTYTAKGVVEYLGKDNWLAELGLRETQPVKITENSFAATLSQNMGYSVLQTNMRVTLPTDVTGMEFDKDEFNYVTVHYKRPTESVMSVGDTGMKTAGYSLLGASLLSMVGLLFLRKRPRN